MSIFVDGVEIAEVFVDGVQMDTVFSDGVEVFTGFESEDYSDTFQGGGLTSAVPMDTGQFWQIIQGSPSLPAHSASIWGAQGNRVSNVHSSSGDQVLQEIRPIVSLINPSFVAKGSMTWDQQDATSNQCSIRLGDANDDTTIWVSGITGVYNIYLRIAGVDSPFITVPWEAWAADLVLYYDGTDIAASGIMYQTNTNAQFPFTFSRRSAQGEVSAVGRGYTCVLLPFFSNVSNDCAVFKVSEVGVPPGDIPWP